MTLLNRIILCLIAIGAGSAPSWGQLLSQPIVGHTTDTSASIWAYAGSGKTVEVEYGLAGSANSALTKISAPPRSDRNHSSLANISGLKAKTSYRYRVLVNGVMAQEGQFTTAPHAHKPHQFSYFLASCMDHKNAGYQHVWDKVAQQNAAFNILAGDNVYADNTNRDVLWNQHMTQRKIPNFAALLRNAPTWATWDDHDFGPNDSHKNTAGKENSLNAFKDLWPNPSYGTPQTPGIFFSYHWANVHFIVLDSRYYRDDENASSPTDKTQFGDAQLNWFYQELKASRSPFKVVVASYDVMSRPYPNEIKRISKFIKDNKIYGVIFHSGDIHKNNFKQQDHGMGYPVTQITSSGITRVASRSWVMVDVNTTLADPTLSTRFFSRETLDSTVVVKLSSLTPAGVSDLIVNNPVGGEVFAAGAQVDVAWTRVGTGISQVNIDYSLGGSQWVSIARAVPNSGSYKWTIPGNINSKTAKVRVSDAANQIQAESQSAFIVNGPPSGINAREGAGEEPILTRLPGSRAFHLKVSPQVESIRVYNLHGILITNLPVLQGVAVWTAPGNAGDRKAPGLHIFKPMLADGSQAGEIFKFIF